MCDGWCVVLVALYMALETTHQIQILLLLELPFSEAQRAQGPASLGPRQRGCSRNGHNNRNALPLGAQTWMTTCCRSNKNSARSCFAELCAFMFYGSATACQGKYLGSVPLQSLLSFEAHAPVGINLSLFALLHTSERARFGIDSCRAAVSIKA